MPILPPAPPRLSMMNVLPVALLERGSDHAADKVGWPAGSIGDDKFHRAIGIVGKGRAHTQQCRCGDAGRKHGGTLNEFLRRVARNPAVNWLILLPLVTRCSFIVALFQTGGLLNA